MTSKSAEQLYASLQRGMQTTQVLEIVKPLLEERKLLLIRDTINAYNSRVTDKKLTERDAMLFVASLAENQRLLDDLESLERDGRRDGEKLQLKVT